MLTLATLGMAGYGAYSAIWGLAALLRGTHLEWWADLALILFGLLLMLSAAFVRVTLPGGFAFALGALLGLQALAIHNAAHLTGRVDLAPQLGRGAFSALLLAMAWLGARRPHTE
ncbi:MAG TPA: hypothetical protein VNE16_00840 [Vicinamibacterales bacterium]|nr:hypothetical protein [Vicinamibacterales bacterium]